MNDRLNRKCIYFVFLHEGTEQEILSCIPWRQWHDLKIGYRCLAAQDAAGIASFPVTNEIMQQLGMEEEELFRLAMKNTPRLFPLKTCSISSMFLQEKTPETEKEDDPEEGQTVGQADGKGAGEGTQETVPETDPCQMYLVTNEQGANGAAAVLYPGAMAGVYDRICGEGENRNLILLPSSIHEMLAVAENGLLTLQELQQMVQEINQECVSAEEKLSDRIYRYHRAEDVILEVDL